MRNFIGIEVKTEPEILVRVELENHLEQRTGFQELIAYYILELSKDFEELVVTHLRVPANILQTIDNLGFKFDQRLNRDLVDLFEGSSVYVFKVLSLELLNELRVGSLHVSLSDDAVLVKLKLFFPKFFMKQLLELLLADMSFIKKALKHQLFLLLPSGVRA